MARLVGFDNLPTALPDDEVEAMRNGLTGQLRAVPHPYLKVGRRVRITRGPLEGREGILLRNKGDLRVVLSIDLIMRSVAVEVGAEDIVPVSASTRRQLRTSLTDITAGYPHNCKPIAVGAAAGPAVALPRFSTQRAYVETFVSTVAILCAGVLTGVLAARLLGPTGRGELAVIIFLPVLLIPLAEFELPRSIAYAVSKQEQASEVLAATSFWLAIALGGVQAILLVFALPLVLPAGKLYLLSTARWFVLYLPAAYITLFLTGIDQGAGRFARFGIFQALPGILYLVAVLVACIIGAISPSAFALAMLCGAVATAILRVAMNRKAILHSRPCWRTASSLLRRGISF